MTTTLTEFLRARIAEDEAVFKAWRHEPWTPMHEDSANGLDADHDGPMIHPGRVRAECEAKRQIVALHQSRYASPSCRECGGYTATASEVAGIVHHGYLTPWPCPTVRLLALAYADHPDYLPEWKP